MNDDRITSTTTRPEVTDFVEKVRARLADLGDDERDELLGGLEADLSEKLADGGPLGDPGAYAAELRAAAGLPARSRFHVRLPHATRPRLHDVGARLDRTRERFDDLVASSARAQQTWSVASALRPAWWVLRAWIVVTFLDQVAGPFEDVTLLPTLAVPLLGPVLLLAAVVASALVGLGRLWPGSATPRSVVARLTLLALNVVAVLLPLGFHTNAGVQQDPLYDGYTAGYRDGVHQPGLRLDSREIRNLFVYDARGQLVRGAQIFRGNGDPLTIPAEQAHTGRGSERLVGCGWLNGSTALFNVFPQPQRAQRHDTCLDEPGRNETGRVAPATPPFAEVPPVTYPGGAD